MNRDDLKALRQAFPDSEIGKLPRIYCTDCKATRNKACDQHKPRAACSDCGQKHSTASFHLDYVGHAETTDRLLDVDPDWNWEPMAFDSTGLPAMDKEGGLWIRLTVCGVTRPAYGFADGKSGGNAIKEAIGDAIRNGAMRFGVALDLWRKTDKVDMDVARAEVATKDEPAAPKAAPVKSAADIARARLRKVCTDKGVPLADIAQRFASDHDESLKTTDKAEAINRLADEIEAAA